MKSADQIRDLYRQYLDAERKGDADKIAAFYTEDAFIVPPERMPIKGRAEIRKHFEQNTNSAVETEIGHIEVDGHVAWATGLFHWNTDGQRLNLVFLDVWRQENGQWQLTGCMWNSSDGIPTM